MIDRWGPQRLSAEDSFRTPRQLRGAGWAATKGPGGNGETGDRRLDNAMH